VLVVESLSPFDSSKELDDEDDDDDENDGF